MNSQEIEDAAKLAALKTAADGLGVDYSGRIGYETLLERVNGAKAEKAKSLKEKPRTLTPIQVEVMKAKSLSKVRIMNLDRDNAGANTVFSGVHNAYLDLSRVVPLNMDIALEEALIKDIEGRRMLVSTPVTDPATGKATGNYKMVEGPMYAVSRIK